MTRAERKLWYALRAHRFGGLGFRRQAPLGRYILDFVCHDRGLVVEVDGGQHFSVRQATRDKVRDRWLGTQGYRVIRIANNEVLTNLEGVLEYLRSLAMDSPLPPCGGARPRFARSEGGELQIRSLGVTPLPILPHKGGGVFVASSVQDSKARR
jgi:very-short-patch-repair endonuclease